MRKFLSTLALVATLVSMALTGPAFAGSKKNGNGAVGVGQSDDVSPPGQTDDPKGNAPGQQKKDAPEPDDDVECLAGPPPC